MTAIEIAQDNTVLSFDEEARQLISDNIAPGASSVEIEVFLKFCEHVQLDPFRSQVWLVPRYDSKLRRQVFKPQVGIDGMRLIAQRSQLYGGSLEPEWCGTDGVWQSIWLDKKTHPAAARFRVVRKDWQEPSVGIATWDQFAPMMGKKGEKYLAPMWQQMGPHMLAKCAEAQALRRAFPAEMAGVYADIELGIANEEKADEPEAVAAVVVDEDVAALIREITPLAQQMDDVAAFKAEINDLCIQAGAGPVEKFSVASLTLEQAKIAKRHAERVTGSDPSPGSGPVLTDETIESFMASISLDGAVSIEAVAEHLGIDIENAVAHVQEWAQS